VTLVREHGESFRSARSAHIPNAAKTAAVVGGLVRQAKSPVCRASTSNRWLFASVGKPITRARRAAAVPRHTRAATSAATVTFVAAKPIAGRDAQQAALHTGSVRFHDR
jgi:hypothetical protein